MAFTPRLTAPSETDLRWIKAGSTWGGYNHCILINENNGQVIPNCTGYVHGRWMEIGETTSDYNLSVNQAALFYTHSDTYERGSTPKLGAVLCFSGGDSEGDGHVAVVEQIIDERTIVCSESDAAVDGGSGRYFYTATHRLEYGWATSETTTLVFQGFIYHPDVDGGGMSGQILPFPGEKPPTKTHSFIYIARGRKNAY